MNIAAEELNLVALWSGDGFRHLLAKLPLSLQSQDVLLSKLTELNQKGDYPQSFASTRDFLALVWGRDHSVSFEVRYGLFLVVSLDGIVGALLVRKIFLDVEIDYVVIDPDYRRRGLARKLLINLEESARSFAFQRIFLEVGVLNAHARALYESAGYREIYVRKSYYSHGEDALVMEREISLFSD